MTNERPIRLDRWRGDDSKAECLWVEITDKDEVRLKAPGFDGYVSETALLRALKEGRGRHA